MDASVMKHPQERTSAIRHQCSRIHKDTFIKVKFWMVMGVIQSPPWIGRTDKEITAGDTLEVFSHIFRSHDPLITAHYPIREQRFCPAENNLRYFGGIHERGISAAWGCCCGAG